MKAKFNLVKGDITTAFDDHGCDIIIHGCNCMGVMGAGVAKALSNKWPKVAKADICGFMHGPYVDYLFDGVSVYICKGELDRLSNYTIATVNDNGNVVINLYTQYTPAKKYGDVMINWVATERGLHHIFDVCDPGTHVAMPEIGCGLAGGEVEDFYAILDRVMTTHPDVKVTIFRL